MGKGGICQYFAEIAEPVPSKTRKLALRLLRRPSSDGLPRNDKGGCRCRLFLLSLRAEGAAILVANEVKQSRQIASSLPLLAMTVSSQQSAVS